MKTIEPNLTHRLKNEPDLAWLLKVLTLAAQEKSVNVDLLLPAGAHRASPQFRQLGGQRSYWVEQNLAISREQVGTAVQLAYELSEDTHADRTAGQRIAWILCDLPSGDGTAVPRVVSLRADPWSDQPAARDLTVSITLDMGPLEKQAAAVPVATGPARAQPMDFPGYSPMQLAILERALSAD